MRCANRIVLKKKDCSPLHFVEVTCLMFLEKTNPNLSNTALNHFDRMVLMKEISFRALHRPAAKAKQRL